MSYQFDVGYIWANAPALLDGLVVTVEVSVISILIAVAIGIVGAAARVLEVPVLAQFVSFYVGFIRNTPLLVQIFFIFFGLPAIGLGLPIFASGVVALAAWGGAYNVENVRGGFLAVPKGLHEAARSLGLRPAHDVLLVAIPVGLRVSIPSVLYTAASWLPNSSCCPAIRLSQ